MARTAIFVSNHGGQSEIVLRVKQGNNPTFGFLMPDHHLHPYFRFLVDHQELLKQDIEGKLLDEKKADSMIEQKSGALTLLGSMYGGGDDEDDATEEIPNPKRIRLKEGVTTSATVSQGPEQTGAVLNVAGKGEVVSKKPVPVPSLKEKVPIIKKNRLISTVEGGNAPKKGESMGSLSTAKEKPSAQPSLPKVEQPVLEPPSELKRVVEKIVEFIQKNGKEFETVLAEQDRNHGRFPFLLPSNQYHPYYLNVLQKAQLPKLPPGKGHISEQKTDKKATISREGDSLSSATAAQDIAYDFDRKEKFKMVIGKSKKDGPDPPPKPTEPSAGVSVDAASAAAILQAATRGIKNPNLEIFPKTTSSSAGSGLGPTIEKVGSAAKGDDKEQKLKAERLKRAKMFAAMVKSRSAPLKNEPSRASSVEPQGSSGVSGSGVEVEHVTDRDREDSLDRDEKSEKSKRYANEFNERRSKRIYRSRTGNEDNDVEEETEEEEEEEEGKRDHKHSRRKHHHSSRSSRDRHKHSKRHSSSSKDREFEHRHSRRRHKHEKSSDEENLHGSRSSKHRKSVSLGEGDLEDGEISMKSNLSEKTNIGSEPMSRGPSVDLLNPGLGGRAPSEVTPEPSDDLRAKIRAMLMATL